MDIIVRESGTERSFDYIIRATIVARAQRDAKEGQTVFLPGPDWTPKQGGEGLIPVKIKTVGDGVATGFDAKGLCWGLWL